MLLHVVLDQQHKSEAVNRHVTAGDEAHMGLLDSDGCEKRDVVLHTTRLATVMYLHDPVM